MVGNKPIQLLLITLALCLAPISARFWGSSVRPSTPRCHAVGFIRAPDLRPGQTFDVDAKLVMHGKECEEVEKWEVGLRLKERAIFRFW